MPFTVSTLFPLSPASFPSDRLSFYLNNLRDSLETVSERLVNPPVPVPSTTPTGEPTPLDVEHSDVLSKEVAHLQATIEDLQAELGTYQCLFRE